MKVPVAIAIAKVRKSMAINRVENKIEVNLFIICKNLRFYKVMPKVTNLV
jgi:hypothetical protein